MGQKRTLIILLQSQTKESQEMDLLLKGLVSSILAQEGKKKRLRIDLEKLDQWVSKGAQLSDRVKKLVKDAKLSPEELQAKLDAKKQKAEEKKAAAEKAAKEAAEAEAKAAEEAEAEAKAAEEAPAEEEVAEEAAEEVLQKKHLLKNLLKHLLKRL